MSETIWMMSESPTEMLELVADRMSERKLRLFACACCRRYWPLLNNLRARQAVEMSEEVADGLSRSARLHTFGVALELQMFDESYFHQPLMEAVLRAAGEDIREAITGVLTALEQLAVREEIYGCIPGESEHTAISQATRRERQNQARLLREVMGNPFRPVEIDPMWLRWSDDCVLHMAQGIYESRQFEELPILADALEEAGCYAPALLNHLRMEQSLQPASQASQHYRGCWALDRLLGRS